MASLDIFTFVVIALITVLKCKDGAMLTRIGYRDRVVNSCTFNSTRIFNLALLDLFEQFAFWFKSNVFRRFGLDFYVFIFIARLRRGLWILCTIFSRPFSRACRAVAALQSNTIFIHNINSCRYCEQFRLRNK